MISRGGVPTRRTSPRMVIAFAFPVMTRLEFDYFVRILSAAPQMIRNFSVTATNHLGYVEAE